MLETILGELPGILSDLVGAFEESEEGNVLAHLAGLLLARVIPDRSEDEIGRFLRAAGQELIDAHEPSS